MQLFSDHRYTQVIDGLKQAIIVEAAVQRKTLVAFFKPKILQQLAKLYRPAAAYSNDSQALMVRKSVHELVVFYTCTVTAY